MTTTRDHRADPGSPRDEAAAATADDRPATAVAPPPPRPTVGDPGTRARRSTIALKSGMAISGLFMILFLLLHMYGNLKAFQGAEAFDSYSEHLRELGTPILPRGGALWINRVLLVVAVLVHAGTAIALWRRNRAATGGAGGNRYRSTQARLGVQRTYASFTLRWGGVVIALFILYHLLHLSANNTIHPGGASDSAYQRLVNGFSVWWVVLSYTVALLAVGLHLRHGTWSALTTLGANTSAARRVQLNRLATALAVVITVGFLLPPFFVVLGVID